MRKPQDEEILALEAFNTLIAPDDVSSRSDGYAGVVSIALALGLEEISLRSGGFSLVLQSPNFNGQLKLNQVTGPSVFQVTGIC